MRDFTVSKYHELLSAMADSGRTFQTFEEFVTVPAPRVIILRHDVDLRPEYSLRFARIQAEAGIRGVYYFRAVPESFDAKIIKTISSLGHEIGYHYENLTTCKGNVDLAIRDFEFNLNRLRQLVPVKTICMHGSPMSRFDSKDLWKYKNYKEFGLLGEPYLDVDYKQVLYLTDTGRRWDGSKVSVRDKVGIKSAFDLHSSDDIIEGLMKDQLQDKIMFTFHPQRWSDSIIPWLQELLIQNIKNVVKKIFFVRAEHQN